MTTNDGWGKPASKEWQAQTAHAETEIAKLEKKLEADGWKRTAHDEWTKDVEAREVGTWGPTINNVPIGKIGGADMGKPDGVKLTDGSYERGDGSIAWPAPAGSDKWQTSPPLAPSPAVEPSPASWGPQPAALPSSSPTGGGWGPSHVSKAPAELPHAHTKPPEVQAGKPDSWPCDLGNGTRYYTGYQTPANYVLLCGPYDTIEEAQARYDIAFERMSRDEAFKWVFPALDKAFMTVLTLPFEKALRKGSYGRL